MELCIEPVVPGWAVMLCVSSVRQRTVRSWGAGGISLPRGCILHLAGTLLARRSNMDVPYATRCSFCVTSCPV